MARNLRMKLPKDDLLIIQDINRSATEKFLEETGKNDASANVSIALSAQEVAEKSVSAVCLFHCDLIRRMKS